MPCIFSCTKNWDPFGVKLSGTAKICHVRSVILYTESLQMCLPKPRFSSQHLWEKTWNLCKAGWRSALVVTQLGDGNWQHGETCIAQHFPAFLSHHPWKSTMSTLQIPHLLVGPAWLPKKPSQVTVPVVWLPLTSTSKLMLLEGLLEVPKPTLKSDLKYEYMFKQHMHLSRSLQRGSHPNQEPGIMTWWVGLLPQDQQCHDVTVLLPGLSVPFSSTVKISAAQLKSPWKNGLMLLLLDCFAIGQIACLVKIYSGAIWIINYQPWPLHFWSEVISDHSPFSVSLCQVTSRLLSLQYDGFFQIGGVLQLHIQSGLRPSL